MQIPIPELKIVHAELVSFRKDSPLWYEIGKNVVITERALKKIEEIYLEDRKIIIDKFGIKEDNGEFKIIEELNEQTGKSQKVHDFGENKAEATKLIKDLYTHTYEKDEQGNVVTVDVPFFRVKEENANKAKEQSLSGLAYSLEYLGI